LPTNVQSFTTGAAAPIAQAAAVFRPIVPERDAEDRRASVIVQQAAAIDRRQVEGDRLGRMRRDRDRVKAVARQLIALRAVIEQRQRGRGRPGVAFARQRGRRNSVGIVDARAEDDRIVFA